MLPRRTLLCAGFVALARAIETSVAFSSSGLVTASSAAAQPSGSASAPVFIPDAASRVNLFVGTTNGGHVFPGEYELRARVVRIALRLAFLQARLFRTGW